VRYPEIRVRLRTENALVLVSAVRHEMRRAGVPRDEILRFSSEALELEDPEKMRRVCSEWVNAKAE
jgi:hypothetical protein